MNLIHPLFAKLHAMGEPILYREHDFDQWEAIGPDQLQAALWRILTNGWTWRPVNYTFMQAIPLLKQGFSFRRECWPADMRLSLHSSGSRIRITSTGTDGAKIVSYSDFLDVNDYEAPDWIPTSFSPDFDQEPIDA